MPGISEGRRDGLPEDKHQGHEQRRHSPDHSQGRTVDQSSVFVLPAPETEQGRLHAESQQGKEKGGIGVEIRHYSVPAALRGDSVGIYGHEQIVQEASDYAAHPVQGRVFQQGSEVHRLNYKKCGLDSRTSL